jgi:hypothetical protein
MVPKMRAPRGGGAPSFRHGLAQGVHFVNLLSSNYLRCPLRKQPPNPCLDTKKPMFLRVQHGFGEYLLHYPLRQVSTGEGYSAHPDGGFICGRAVPPCAHGRQLVSTRIALVPWRQRLLGVGHCHVARTLSKHEENGGYSNSNSNGDGKGQPECGDG